MGPISSRIAFVQSMTCDEFAPHTLQGDYANKMSLLSRDQALSSACQQDILPRESLRKFTSVASTTKSDPLFRSKSISYGIFDNDGCFSRIVGGIDGISS